MIILRKKPSRSSECQWNGSLGKSLSLTAFLFDSSPLFNASTTNSQKNSGLASLIRSIVFQSTPDSLGIMFALVEATASKLGEHVEIVYKQVNNEVSDKDSKKHWESLIKVASELIEKTTELLNT